MTKSHIWWRRTGVAGLGLALTLSTALTGINTASAAPSTNDNTIVPVRGAIPNSDDNPVGTITFDEDFGGQFFPAGVDTTVTLTLSDGVFSPNVVPDFDVPAGYEINPDVEDDEDAETPSPGSSTYTFVVSAPAVVPASGATITVDGLFVDLPEGLTGTVTITASPGDENVALKVLDRVRIGGQDRYETAAKIFRAADDAADGLDTDSVVLSGGENFPDALSANYLAGQLDTGVLLTRTGFLSPETREVILDYGVSKVYITGGTGAVSQAVEDELKSTRISGDNISPYIQVIRLGGADRYATNKKINQYTQDLFPAATDTALIATGRNFADALALGPIAYSQGFPVILTPGNTFGATAQSQIDEYNPDNIVIAGSTAVVSQAIEDDLEDATPGDDVDRYGGDDRTYTACYIADWAEDEFGNDEGGGFSFDDIAITNGANFPDALAGGSLMGVLEGPILLSKSRDVLGGGTEECLSTRSVDDIGGLIALGLTGATSVELIEDAASAVGANDPSAAAVARALTAKLG